LMIIYAILFIVTVIPLVIPLDIERANLKIKEEFNVELSNLNSLDECNKYINNNGALKNEFDTVIYVNSVSDFLKKRFYHGLSNYTLSENWIAYVSGKLFWSHFSAVVNPEDILKRTEGLCSQQNIVFTELLKSKHITSRAVGLGTKKGPGHYLSEVWYGGNWHLYDVDIEPNWEVVNFEHLSMDSLIKNKTILYSIYNNRLSKAHLNTMLENVRYGIPNEYPAKRMLLFHRISKAFTYVIPAFFLMMFLRMYVKRKRLQE
jgi:hypothetical protein